MLNVKSKSNVFSALANSDTKINIINRMIVKKIKLSLLNMNVGLSAIYGDAIKIYEIYYIEFQQKDKKDHVRYFQDIFLIANINTRIILDIS